MSLQHFEDGGEIALFLLENKGPKLEQHSLDGLFFKRTTAHSHWFTHVSVECYGSATSFCTKRVERRTSERG